MKKYFRFDDEPITGGQFLGRMYLFFLGYLLLVIPGLWLHMATIFKRAGAFNWSLSVRRALVIFFLVAITLSSASAGKSSWPTVINLIIIFLSLANGNKPKDEIS